MTITAETGNLAWTTSASADWENHDQEADLAAIGNPGGAEWASVSPDHYVTYDLDARPVYGAPCWKWGIYRRWLWEDIDADPERNILAEGQADDEDAAKAAVSAWVANAQAEDWALELDLVRLGGDAG